MNKETFELLTLLKSNKKAIDKLGDSSEDCVQDLNQNFKSDLEDPSDAQSDEEETFGEERSNSSSVEESDN